MPKPLVLIVDDDPGVCESLERSLSLEGFAVQSVGDGSIVERTVKQQNPDVIVLDVGLPGVDGVTLCRRLRDAGNDTPICILSARDETSDRVAGLQAGADDYLIKPFAIAELVARLEALLRRRPAAATDRMVVGDLIVDPARHLATLGGEPLHLTGREFAVLETLARNANIVLSRHQLLEEVWGYEWDADTNVVDVFIGYLRKKTEADGRPRIIDTVRGVGFVLRG